MKILFLINTTQMSGATISFIKLIKGLYQNNVECYVVYPDRTINKNFKQKIAPYVKGLFYARIKEYHYLKNKPFKLNVYIRQLVKKTSLYQLYKKKSEDSEIEEIVKRIKPDIIHSNVGVIQVGYRVSRKLNIPHVWHLREYQTKDFNFIIEPSYSKFVDMLHHSYVISITHDILKYFQLENYSKAKCIYNGCFSFRDTSLKLPKKKYFLCCSRIAEEKGYEDIINAFGIFHQKFPEYKLLIVGFGNEDYVEKIKNIAIENKSISSIKFLGYRDDVRQLMDYASALIVASRFEGFGRMTAEAAFRGCLVIGHNTGGTKEILDQIGGFPYDGGVKDLEATMEEAINCDEGEYRSRALYAQKKAQMEFSDEQYIKNVLSFYKGILSKN